MSRLDLDLAGSVINWHLASGSVIYSYGSSDPDQKEYLRYGFTALVNKFMLKIQNRPSTVEVKAYKKVKPLYPSHYTDSN